MKTFSSNRNGHGPEPRISITAHYVSVPRELVDDVVRHILGLRRRVELVERRVLEERDHHVATQMLLHSALHELAVLQEEEPASFTRRWLQQRRFLSLRDETEEGGGARAER